MFASLEAKNAALESEIAGLRGTAATSKAKGDKKAELGDDETSSRIKSRLQLALQSMSQDDSNGAALGLPTITLEGHVSLPNLSENLKNLHYGMTGVIRTQPMRLLKISSALSSATPTCFEDVDPGDFIQCRDQWDELCAILRAAERVGFAFVWVDWSCVVQVGDNMRQIYSDRLTNPPPLSIIISTPATPWWRSNAPDCTT